MSSIGERIKTIRGEMSQESFASALGIKKNSLGFYERDERTPKSTTIATICERFCVNGNWLLFGEGPMRREGGSEMQPATMPHASKLDATMPSNDASGGRQEEIRELRKENTELRRECSELRTENQRLNRELSEANKELINTSKELLQTTRENADLRVNLAEIKTRAAPDTPDEDARLSA